MPGIGRWKMLDNLRRTLSAPLAVRDPGRRAGRCRRVPAGRVDRVRPRRRSILPRAARRSPAWCRAGRASRSAATCARWPATSPRRDPDRASASPSSPTRLADGRRDRAHPHASCVTRRNLLEWMTAAQAKAQPRPRPRRASYRRMAGGVVLAVAARRPRRRPEARRRAGRRCRSSRSGSSRRSIARGSACRPTVAADAAVRRARSQHAAAHGAPDVAVLRGVRRPEDHAPAARQLPGGPGAGRRPPHVADEHRAVPAVDRDAPATSAGSAPLDDGRAARGARSRRSAGSSASAATSTTGTTRATSARWSPPTSPRWTAETSPGTCSRSPGLPRDARPPAPGRGRARRASATRST